jgi:hypothetical protein
VLSLCVEINILNQDNCQIISFDGINLWFGYFSTNFFIIWDAYKLCNVDNHDFWLYTNKFGTCVIVYYVFVYFWFCFLSQLFVVLIKFLFFFFCFAGISKASQRTINLMLISMLQRAIVLQQNIMFTSLKLLNLDVSLTIFFLIHLCIHFF